MRASCSCHWARPSSLCARQPYLPDSIQAFQIFVRLPQVNPCPMPHAPYPMPAWLSLPTEVGGPGGRQGRHRHDPSAVEVRNLGSPWSRPPARPLQSTNSLSWPPAAAIPSSRRGATDDCVTSLPARHLPSLSACGRHCRSTANEASTPSPVGRRCGCCESPSPRPDGRPLPSQPSQPRPGTRRHRDSRPHFAEIQISQNPTGWAPQRSLAPRTCRAPLPVCLSPSQSPSLGALAAPPMLQRITILLNG